ncbi:MAG: hypothetical protein PHW69_05730 [Elusimicrobiaceae bacterium]|nr:hypothetical protein [Elusimicrobiaceae bacterium]
MTGKTTVTIGLLLAAAICAHAGPGAAGKTAADQSGRSGTGSARLPADAELQDFAELNFGYMTPPQDSGRSAGKSAAPAKTGRAPEFRDAYAPPAALVAKPKIPAEKKPAGRTDFYLPELDIAGETINAAHFQPAVAVLRVPGDGSAGSGKTARTGLKNSVTPAVLEPEYERPVSIEPDMAGHSRRKIRFPAEQKSVVAPGYVILKSSVQGGSGGRRAPQETGPAEFGALLNELNGARLARFSQGARVRRYLYGNDFRVRTVYDTGALGAPVARAQASDAAGHGTPFYRFATLAVDMTAARENGGLGNYVRKITDASGFLPDERDLDASPDGEIALVRGWLPPKKAAVLRKSGLVRSVRVGKRACDFEPGQTAYTMPVVLTISVPARYRVAEFVETALGRLHRHAGFSWRKTLSADKAAVPDLGGETAYVVRVAGRLPFDAFRRAASYPFVQDIEPASIQQARRL